MKSNFVDSLSDKRFQESFKPWDLEGLTWPTLLRDRIIDNLFDKFSENTVFISLIDDEAWEPCNDCCWCELP